MRRVSIFGGSFNPPHLAHTRIAESAADQYQLDEVCWIPAGDPPHKTIRDISAVDRLAMTRLATGNNSRFSVSSIEIERDGPSYTVDTLLALQEQWEGTQFFLLIGQDSLAAFSTWKNPALIVELAELIVYPRFDFASDTSVLEEKEIGTPASGAPRWLALEGDLLPISSSDIRNRVRRGQSIAHLVEEKVGSYIESHRLYLSEQGT